MSGATQPGASPRVHVVAIDGPVGVGKSTVARAVAERLGFRHIDTGAMYRAVVHQLLQLPPGDRSADNAAAIAESMRLNLAEDGRVLLDGADVTDAIRDEEVSRNVHLAADNRRVREALVAQQRRLGEERPSVLEGRDIGTVVFPDAQWKIYLDADPAERVRRRVEQFRAAGRSVDEEAVAANLRDRDERDKSRPWGALRRAEDAELLDSSTLTEQQVVQAICDRVLGGVPLAS